MKRPVWLIFTLLLILACVSSSFAGRKNGENDFKIKFSEDSAGVSISIGLEAGRDFRVQGVEKQKKEFSSVSFDSCLLTTKKGFPEVPFFKIAIQLRDDRDYELVVKSVKFSEHKFTGNWLPSRGKIPRNKDPEKVPYEIDQSSVVDALYPADGFVILGGPFLIREVRGIGLAVFPALVNTAEKKVKILERIEFALVPVGAEKGTNPHPNRKLKIFRDNLSLYNALFRNFRWDHELDDRPGDMLVIHTERDAAAIQDYITHKQSLGFDVTSQQVVRGIPWEDIKQIIQDAYDINHDLLYVQLVGDWEDIQCNDTYAGDPMGDPMDNEMAQVAGTDNYYDLIIARFSAESADQVTIQVNKTITYEQNPNQDWWKSGLGIASDQGPGDDSESDSQHIGIIREHKLLPFGYTWVGEVYDPEAAASSVASAINAGVHVINYCGHGDMWSWLTTGFGFGDINALNNGDKLPIIFSVACKNGAYHGGTCFAEAWLRKQNSGAVAALMSTINQDWEPPMRGQDYMNDLLTGGYDYGSNPGIGTSTDRGKTRIGSIVFNAFNLQLAEADPILSEAGPGDVGTTNTWVLFGDGSLSVVPPPPCPPCSGDEVTLENVTFASGSTCECVGAESITIGAAVIVESGADVTFKAPKVNIKPGFHARTGSVVKILMP